VSGTSYRAETTGRWDLDLSGRLAASLTAEEARLALARAQAEDTRRRVAADLAVRVVQLRALAARLSVRDDALAALRGQVDIAERRRAAGLSSASEGARLLSEAAQAEAVSAGLQRERREILQATAFELAVSASTLEGWLETRPDSESSACVIEAGTPGELLSRRADLLAAYQAVAAAVADRQAVERGLQPNLIVDTALGWSALSLSKLFSGGALIYSAAATLDLKLFDFGRIDAQIDGARAAERESWLRYRSAAHQAITDVESALTSLSTSREAETSLHAASNHQSLLVQNGRQRQSAGLADSSGILEALQAEALLREQMAGAHFQEMRAVVLLIRALGAPS
jgi:outer membrane protein TolC